MPFSNEETRARYNACVEALKNFVDGCSKAHERPQSNRHVLLGLSGGIDSSVTAAMCVEALGAHRVHGYLLPGPYSSDHSIADALALANNLGIATHTLSIKGAYEACKQELEGACSEEETGAKGNIVPRQNADGVTLELASFEGLASENTQARLRMVFLMAISNAHDWLLINTGNRTEALMGYSTLYGDTAGAFAPLGASLKTEVYAFGRLQNEQARLRGQEPPIPENVFTKAPSAELSPGQTDESSLGNTYAKLDVALEILYGSVAVEGEGTTLPNDELLHQAAEKSCISLDELASITRRVQTYAFKRALEPAFPNLDLS